MDRLYEAMAYGDAPIRESYWLTHMPETRPVFQKLEERITCEFAVVGGGYTGLFAALRLAEAGHDVVLLDAREPGWGASGRNGGLVSVGGSKLEDPDIVKLCGQSDAAVYFQAERAAVDLVEETITRHGLDVDRHSKGYSFVAHNVRAIDDVKAYGEQYKSRYGLDYTFLDKEAMIAEGLNSPDFHAGAHLPIGFALNPMKFVLAMTEIVAKAGVRIYSNSEVQSITSDNGYRLVAGHGEVQAKSLLMATNGYSSDDLPHALRNRYLPVQSNILVSRPLRDEEIAAQGWFSEQMVCDSRTLLHYFRLLPDKRMLLGLRGSVRVTPEHMAATRQKARRDFDRMFPEWRAVETPYFWSGLICMARNLMPFAGPLPGMERAYAAMAYHGNGVTMGPYCGTLMADMAMGKAVLPHADFMKKPMRRFELGPWRRASLPLAFSWYGIKDRF